MGTGFGGFLKHYSFRIFFLTLLLIASGAVSLISRHAWADDTGDGSNAAATSDQSGGQTTDSDSDDAYDPFIDYNEYDNSGDEEADINFFENGRLLTAALLVGGRTFTNGFKQMYSDSVAYGGYLSYFFDLRFALQISYTTSSHSIVVSGGGQTAKGNVTFNEIGLDLKYYFNMDDVKKGLANFNPYVIAGFSPITRTSTVSGESEFTTQSAVAFDAGAGFEIPILRREMFIGGQAMYQMVNFPDQYSEITLNNGTIHTGIYPNGAIITYLGILGINF